MGYQRDAELERFYDKKLNEVLSVKGGLIFLVLEGCNFLIKLAMLVCGSSDIVMRSILVLLESLLLLIYQARKLLGAVDSKGVIVQSAFCSFNVRLPLVTSPAEEPLEVDSFFTDVCAFILDLDNKLELLVI